MEQHQGLLATSPLGSWLTHLEKLHSQPIELGLARVAQVAGELDLLRPAPFIFTVGGTNGKGTTCRMLETLLIASGYRVGVYSSPHLIHYTERVRIQGETLAEQQHSASLAKIEQGRGNISLTYFEFSTLSALSLFANAKLDVVILEVGLGGRLDATNIVDADVAVITSIALDHTDWLGPDRQSIGYEKSGIFRAHKPAVVGEVDLPDSVVSSAAERQADLQRRGVEWHCTREQESWHFQDRSGQLLHLPLPKIPLSNAATALAALRASGLAVSESVIRECLPQVTLAGRFQIISQHPRVILDVAHNPHAAQYLASQLQCLAPVGRLFAVVAMLHDKDIEGTLSALSPQITHWYCASLDLPRGAKAAELVQHLPQAAPYNSVKEAWQAALTDATEHDTILVCGSFHTVAEVMIASEQERRHGK